MNLFLICHVYPPEHAPAGVNILELAEDLGRSGHQVTVITGWPSHPAGPLYPGWKARFRQVEQTTQGFRLIRCGHSFCSRKRLLGKLWYYFTFAINSFLNGLRAGKADAILYCSTPIFGDLTALLLAKLKRAHSLYWIHDVHPEATRNAGILRERSLAYRVLLALDKFVCRQSTLVATLTETMRDLLLARGLDPKRVVLMPHWVDSQKIAPRDRDTAWRREQGIGLDKFVVLHAGTIGYISGAEVIIKAARALAPREEILFLFVGDGPIKEKLVQEAQGAGLPNVRFLPFQPAEVLADVQATGDVGLVTLLPGTGESSIPSKMHGYTAAARPVIASVADNSPTAQMIRAGEFGIVCPCQDAEALASAIRCLAEDRARAQHMGEKARRFFVEVFDRASGTRRAEELLTTLGPAPRAQ